MAKVGAQRAAELTGRSKSTVQRAMNSGKLSFTIDGNDRRVIDVAELERVFGLKNQGSTASAPSAEEESERTTTLIETERLKMRVRLLEEQLEMAQAQIEDLKSQRDQWQRQASQVLLTSQYNQKQAEELRAEIRRREDLARQRRQRLEEEVGKRRPQNENRERGSARPLTDPDGSADTFNFKGLWRKVKGEV